MSKFAQNAKDEIKAIEALGSVLEPGKLLVVTSGVGITSGAPGQVRKETDPPTDSPCDSAQAGTGGAGGGGKGCACGDCASAAGARHAQAGAGARW